MKHLTSIILSFSIFMTIGYAQPELKKVDDYKIGTERIYHQSNADSIGHIKTGNGVTWDFTNLPQGRQSNQNIQPPDSGQNGDQFPEANLLESYDFGNRIYHEKQNDRNLIHGIYASRGVLAEFIKPLQIIKRPFTMQDEVTDTAVREYQTQGRTFKGTGFSKTTAQGYGTLKTPAGEFSNTMLLKNEQNWKDTSQGFGLINTNTNVTYIWYTANEPHPLLRLDSVMISNNFFTDTVVTLSYFKKDKQTGIQNKSLQTRALDVYEQDGLVIIKGRLKSKMKAGISLRTVSGKTIRTYERELQQGYNRIALPLPDVKPGFYILSAAGNQRSFSKKLMIR